MAYDPTKPTYYDLVYRPPTPQQEAAGLGITEFARPYTGGAVSANLTTGQPITGAALQPSSAITPEVPQPQSVPDVKGLDTTIPATLTGEESKAQDLTTEIQRLNEQFLGQSAFRTEQEGVAGIPDLQKTQTDLSARLKGLQNEALAIPLQLEQESVGRGRTAGGAQPLQTERLRDNAIKALTVSSLLEASRGNLATAQDMVDRAVAAKYDPILEQQRVKTANLDLILKSPAYSLADKNRAAAQKAIEDARTARITADRKNEEEARAEALKYSGIASAPQLAEMQKQTTALGVASVAAKYGLKTSEQRKIEAEIAKTIGEDRGLTKGEAFQAERAERTIQSVDELLVKADANPQIFGRSAAVPIPDFLRSGAFRDFEAELKTLKSTIAFGELTAMREASKTGGALGQVSNIELGLLESALGALDMRQSPENFKAQLNKVRSSIERWKKAGGSVQPSSPSPVLKSPDGKQFVNTSELTPKQVQEAQKAGWK